MSTSTSAAETARISVLHVDDDREVRALIASALTHEVPALDVQSAASALEALEQLDGVDCIVSDYDMPEMDGLAFLKRVRDIDTDLPFVLYTGAGSEELASEAISAGVSDYLQKLATPQQYALLANRVKNLATQYRTAMEMRQQQRRFRRLVEHSSDVVSIVDANGVFTYLSPAARHVFGYDPEELVGQVGFDYLHPDDVEDAVETLFDGMADPTFRPVITFRFAHPERGWIVLENTGRNLLDDPTVEGFLINSHDVTARVEHAAELKRQRDRLSEFAGVVSHDLRNPLAVAGGNLSLIERTGDTGHTVHVREALERMERIIDDLLSLARDGDGISDLSVVPLRDVAEAAWQSVDTASATLSVETDMTLLADAGRLQQLFENLFSNAVAHAGPSTHVRVVKLADEVADYDHLLPPDTTTGFAVIDDGPGIPPADRDRVFEHGVSLHADKTGFGLAIVRQVAEAHGWSASVTDAPDGGASFEFRTVSTDDDTLIADAMNETSPTEVEKTNERKETKEMEEMEEMEETKKTKRTKQTDETDTADATDETDETHPNEADADDSDRPTADDSDRPTADDTDRLTADPETTPPDDSATTD